jgi:transposase
MWAKTCHPLEFVEKPIQTTTKKIKSKKENDMAKYRHTDAEDGQGLFLSVDLKGQLLAGTFEYMLDEIINKKIDTSIFDRKYKNDLTGAGAIPPTVLLKLIIYGYSKGRKSSRGIWELNRDNIMAKALTNDMQIHWTTIADFISGNSQEFEAVFMEVLAYCNELGLVGGETFAIDGLRLPSNASLQMSGTEEELKKKLGMYRRMAEKHVRKHRKQDAQTGNDDEQERHYQERQKHLNRQIEKIGGFLEGMKKRENKRDQELKSNVTDNESAMIRSASGYLQGYIGIAVSDKQNQIIISAEAVGNANETEYMPGLIQKTLENIKDMPIKRPEGTKPTFLADANYFSEENLAACQEQGVQAIIPDTQYRRQLENGTAKRYEAKDFKYHAEEDYYECPNGKKLECKRRQVFEGREARTYEAGVKDCRCCPLNPQCKRAGDAVKKRERGRMLMITGSNKPGSLCCAMRDKMSDEEYQNKYAYRIQIIEPVFANISYCKGLNRFMLRGKRKINGQWKLYCMVHNLGKCLKEYNKERGYA